MIFKETWQQVLDGTKTQTRRPVKEGEYGYRMYHPDVIQVIYKHGGYIKWRVGKDYAVQPGRGKKAVGRIRITGIRRERLQEIRGRDVLAEGCGLAIPSRREFMELWDSLYRNTSYEWKRNPEVWVLIFEKEE